MDDIKYSHFISSLKKEAITVSSLIIKFLVGFGG